MMTRGFPLFLGVLATYISALFGINLIPRLMLQRVAPEGTILPYAYDDLELRGRSIYVREGCVYCHTQQVRAKENGSDIARGWGTRSTVAQDYVHDQPAVLGTMRTGPDLANIGARQPSDQWHLQHLFNPKITSSWSNMPPFPWLFEKQGKYTRGLPVEIPEKFLPAGGGTYVPTEEALALVAYLKSMKRSYPIEAGK